MILNIVLTFIIKNENVITPFCNETIYVKVFSLIIKTNEESFWDTTGIHWSHQMTSCNPGATFCAQIQKFHQTIFEGWWCLLVSYGSNPVLLCEDYMQVLDQF